MPSLPVGIRRVISTLGWLPQDYDESEIPFEPGSVRVARLEEAARHWGVNAKGLEGSVYALAGTTQRILGHLDTWGDDVLRWELRPDKQGCLLIFIHTFEDRSAAARFAAGWHSCLDVLKSRLNGEPVAPPDNDRWVELFDGYAARLG